MDNKLLRKGLVFSVIFLFFGMAVQPITSVNITQIKKEKSDDKINDSNNKEDCFECNILDEFSIIEVDKLLIRIKSVLSYILQVFNDIPEIKEKCKESLNIININDRPELLCSLLEIAISTLQWIAEILYRIPFLYSFIYLIEIILTPFYMSYMFFCYDYNP